MAEKKPDGGPAFPVEMYSPDSDGDEVYPGMSLRDWFAGHIVQGCLAYSHYNESWGDYHNNGTNEALARHVYEVADAMLAERDKT